MILFDYEFHHHRPVLIVVERFSGRCMTVVNSSTNSENISNAPNGWHKIQHGCKINAHGYAKINKNINEAKRRRNIVHWVLFFSRAPINTFKWVLAHNNQTIIGLFIVRTFVRPSPDRFLAHVFRVLRRRTLNVAVREFLTFFFLD